MSLSTTYAFDPGASHPSNADQIGELVNFRLAGRPDVTPAPASGAELVPRQLQITTTITPTITRGAPQAAVPTRTEPRGRPVPSAAAATASSAEKDDSLFPANLSWWQILGIAVAGVALLGIIAYIFISRRNKAKLAELKAKEAELEEGRKAKDSDDSMPRGMGMGLGMGGLGMGMGGMGGMGMGMGMGGMPMMYGQNDGGGGGRGKKGKKRYDSSDSESESDGGTIRPSRRKGRRKYGRRGGRRKDDCSSDETLSSAASSSYYARPSKGRHRNEKDDKRYRDRRRQESTKTPTSRDNDYPLGLGPPTTGLPTSSTRKSPGRKGSLKRFQDSVFSTFDSMTNKAAKLEALRNQAIEAKKLENELQLKAALKVEADLEEQRMRREIESVQQRQDQVERQRQAKVREANARIKAEEKG